MPIKTTEEPDIHLTQSEREQYRREWESACQYTASPPSFESFVRSRKRVEKQIDLISN